jgi:hypothetical protein
MAYNHLKQTLLRFRGGQGSFQMRSAENVRLAHFQALWNAPQCPESFQSGAFNNLELAVLNSPSFRLAHAFCMPFEVLLPMTSKWPAVASTCYWNGLRLSLEVFRCNTNVILHPTLLL